MSNLGKWDNWYVGLDGEQPYGDTVTYALGAEFLKDCSLIEDWGCGKGWFRKFVSSEQYRGLDGSQSPFADEIVDLVLYSSHVPGIYIRHVLEHNYEWRAILSNALASFTQRMVLVLFTPLSFCTHSITFADNPGVPDIAFSLIDLETLFREHWVTFRMESFETATQYGRETIFYLEKK